MPYPKKGECRNTGRTRWQKGCISPRKGRHHSKKVLKKYLKPFMQDIQKVKSLVFKKVIKYIGKAINLKKEKPPERNIIFGKVVFRLYMTK